MKNHTWWVYKGDKGVIKLTQPFGSLSFETRVKYWKQFNNKLEFVEKRKFL